MDSRERFFATINREPVDRPASRSGIPVTDAIPGLYDYFNVDTMSGLKEKLNDDIWPLEVPYDNPPSNHIACAFDFAAHDDYDERTLTEGGWFQDKTDPACVNEFPWPDPKDHMSVEVCRAAIDEIPDGWVKMGVLWSSHFQDACAAFGMENAMIAMMLEPDMFQAVIDRAVEFYLEANEIFYKAADGDIDVVLIGNDMGSQGALMVDPDSLRKFVFPGTKKLIDQAHSYGIKVMHHSCGAIREVIPDLIDLGVDIIHPIQALATGMEPQGLSKDFGQSASFCGGVDAQNLLVNGTAEEIGDKVEELKSLFPTGLILSPSHEAILPDVPPQNIEALFSLS